MQKTHNKYLAGKILPRGEHHLPVTDVSGLIVCGLEGPGCLRPTTVYVEPLKLAATRDKHQRLGNRLIIPKWAEARYRQQLDEYQEMKLEIELLPVTTEHSRKSDRAVICLNTGRYYATVKLAATAVGMSSTLLATHLAGKIRSAKGRRMRFATGEEIAAVISNPRWHFRGELLPVIPLGVRKF